MKNHRNLRDREERDREDANINISLRNTFIAKAILGAVIVIGAGYFAAQMPIADDDYQPQPVAQTQAVKPVLSVKPEIRRQSLAEAEAAKRATYDRAIEMRSGYCSRAVRQVVRKSQGRKYDYLFGATAHDTGNNLLRAGYGCLWPSQKAKLGGKILPGDILVKRYVLKNSRGLYFGHIGIFVGNDLVWENSSTSIGRLSGAKGYRSLTQFGFYSGSVDVVARFPAPGSKSVAK